jgi:hypothetical protein
LHWDVPSAAVGAAVRHDFYQKRFRMTGAISVGIRPTVWAADEREETMNVRQRHCLLSMTILVAVVSTSALGQTLPPAVGSVDRGTRSATPDFSGIWAHLTWPDFEPPLEGPGPVTNRSRRNGVSNTYQLVGDYTSPILKPHAAEVVKRLGEISLSGTPYPTPSNQCWPGGMPFVLWNIGMQMIQQPDKITFLYSNDHEVRHVRMNQPHPAQVTPSWYGDSVGHYEGDTLVIDTVGVKIGPFAVVDMYGTPYSQALHVVERYRLLDYQAAKAAEERGQRELSRIPGSDPGFARDLNYRGQGLQLEFTVEDEGVFTKPWSAAVSYRRPLSPLGQWPEMVCADTTHDFITGNDIRLPSTNKPDF